MLGWLALGTFAIGTDGFVVAGVLPALARDMHARVGQAGLIVTAFALVYGLTAPVLTAVLSRTGRRTVLVGGMAVLSAANLGAAMAPSERWLLAARVVAAIGAAMYSPIALATAVQLSPPAERGRAVSRVLAGMTVSLVVGVPLGALFGSLAGWRWTFCFVSALSALAGLGIASLVPAVPPPVTSSLGARLRLLRRPAVVANLAATLLWITGAFTAYTFIVPLLQAATGWRGPPISTLLLAYGAAAFAGNAAGGHAADRLGARRSIMSALVSLVASLGTVGLAARIGPPAGIPVVIVALLAWAAAGWSLTPAQSHRLVALTPDAGAEVLSLNTSAVYFGIAAGAAVGGQVLAHGGVTELGVAAAGFQLLALAVVAVTRERAAPGPVTRTRTAPAGIGGSGPYSAPDHAVV